MAHLTINELTDIVLEADQNAVQARHIYQVQFPNRRIPNIRAIVSSVEDQPGTRRLAGQHNISHSTQFSICSLAIYHLDRNFANGF
jgi:hypothetical protein